MPDPRNIVDASTPAVADILTDMTRIVLARGGVLHPGLTMVERDGVMTVLCADHPDAAPHHPLFNVPRDMLIPVDGAQWADSRSTLVLKAPPPDLTSMQRDLLDLHVALYNACGKLPWTVANHPRLGLGEAPDVVSAVQALRPGFTEAGAAPHLSSSASEPSEPGPDDRSAIQARAIRDAAPPPVEVFLNTRVFGLKPVDPAALAPPEANDQTDRRIGRAPTETAALHRDEPASAATPASQRVLMTLIDLLNHHPQGADFRVDARAMTPSVARPTGTDECFAHYGHRRDSLDLALNYGYVDTATQFVHCPPLTVEVPIVGSLRILGHSPRGKASSPLNPPHITSDATGLALSHVVVRPPESGVRWDLPVVMALQGRALQLGATPAQARQVAEAGVAALYQRMTALLTALRNAAQAEGGATPAAGVLAGVAEHQLDLLGAARPQM